MTATGGVMKIVIAIAGLVVCLAVALTPRTALAQEEPDEGSRTVDVAVLFGWYSGDDPDWGTGALYSALGLVGAMVVAFGLIGGAVPGTVGKAKIDEDEARLARLERRAEEVAFASSVDTASLTALGTVINELRDDVRSERWRQYSLATFLYAILGAFFATMLARDLLQALAIGAGWTGLLGSLGLRSDFAQRKSTKDEALKETTNAIRVTTEEESSTRLSPKAQSAVDQAEVALAL